MKKYFILLTLFFISYSSLTFGNTLLLKCTSLKFFDDDWVGNILFVKIDEEKSRVYLNEPANKTTGWTMNKLTSVKSDFFTFENCENIKCENSQFNK